MISGLFSAAFFKSLILDVFAFLCSVIFAGFGADSLRNRIIDGRFHGCCLGCLFYIVSHASIPNQCIVSVLFQLVVGSQYAPPPKVLYQTRPDLNERPTSDFVAAICWPPVQGILTSFAAV